MEGQPQGQNEQLQPVEQQRVKTLGVRIEEGLHAQLSFIAQLTGNTLADEIRGSIEARVAAAQDDPDLVARAEAVHAEIEREAQARRQAIAGFFGKVALEDTVTPPTTPNRRGAGRKTTSGEPAPEQT